MKLNTLNIKIKTKKKKRLGRGIGYKKENRTFSDNNLFNKFAKILLTRKKEIK